MENVTVGGVFKSMAARQTPLVSAVWHKMLAITAKHGAADVLSDTDTNCFRFAESG